MGCGQSDGMGHLPYGLVGPWGAYQWHVRNQRRVGRQSVDMCACHYCPGP